MTEMRENFTGRLDIEPNRHLISEHIAKTLRIEEFASVATKERVITVPAGDATAGIHRELAKRRMNVFPITASDEKYLVLSVSPDARRVDSSLKFIARDPERYAEIFKQLGGQLARLQSNGLGLPDRLGDRGILASVAIASSDSEKYGSDVYLIPPYNLNTDITKQDELGEIKNELVSSEHFTLANADFLQQQVDEGWNEFRR